VEEVPGDDKVKVVSTAAQSRRKGMRRYLRCRICQSAEPMRRSVWPTDHHITRLLVDSLVSLKAISRFCTKTPKRE
jgi:hypothetical protein